MPFYRPIKDIKPKKTRLRMLAGLKALRMQMDEEMPHKTKDSTLILGTWNIRNFDDNRFMSGHRTKEDLYYIAEIISRFDVLAVQEICENLDPLDKIMKILGYDFDYIVTDVTEGRSGNAERLGFIFDRNKVKFKGIAGELVLPEEHAHHARGKTAAVCENTVYLFVSIRLVQILLLDRSYILRQIIRLEVPEASRGNRAGR